MLNQRLAAAREVGDQLIATERAIDAAVTEAAKLAACMPRVRLEANIGAEIGHAALERSGAALAALVTARREIIATHAELSTVKDRIGLRTVAVGGSEYKGPRSQIMAVADAA